MKRYFSREAKCGCLTVTQGKPEEVGYMVLLLQTCPVCIDGARVIIEWLLSETHSQFELTEEGWSDVKARQAEHVESTFGYSLFPGPEVYMIPVGRDAVPVDRGPTTPAKPVKPD